MAQPPKYVPDYDFADWQSAHPSDPLPGNEVDSELGLIKATTDAIIDNLGLIQRDDGALANASVHPDALSAATVAMLGEWTPRGAWVTATVYAALDVVRESSINYVCVTTHTAGVFATDLAAGKWQSLSSVGTNSVGNTQLAQMPANTIKGNNTGGAANAKDLTVAETKTLLAYAGSDVANTPAGNIAATTVQAAINELDTEKAPVSHTHASTAITDFAEAVDDRVAAFLVAGDNITFDLDDAGNEMTINADAGGRLIGRVVITASGDYTKNANASYIIVHAVGGGGGAGGITGVANFTPYAGAGGGGGAAIKKILAASIGATETVTIGAGGNGGGATSAGSDGGTTSFGSHCSASGGIGGSMNNANAVSGTKNGRGGVGSSGDVNLRGGDGLPPWSMYSAALAHGTPGGRGGGQYGSAGAAASLGAAPVNGSAAEANSGGGGGGGHVVYNSGASTATGGNGGSGIVVVEEYS